VYKIHQRGAMLRVRLVILLRKEGPRMGTPLPIFIMVTLAILFGILVMVLTTILGPKKPSPEKLAPYECGIQEIEPPKRRFPVKYLLTGMLFIVFDIEIVSFYPLAILLKNHLQVLGLIELLIFLVILMIGYVYVWRKGAFKWD
jgi:NADH-quinone oxidoreductase subunit A